MVKRKQFMRFPNGQQLQFTTKGIKMRLDTVLSCLWLVVLFNVLEAKTGHNGKLKKWVDPKHRTLKRRTDLKIGEAADDFHKHCAEIFLDKTLTANVVHGMMMGVMNKLEELCIEKPIHPLIHKTFTESLLCGESMSVAISKVVDILFGQLVKKCYEKPGFRGVFVFTTTENEIEESKNIMT